MEGKKLSDVDILVWCMLIVAAGNETTRNATSGGMLALIEHQDQMRKLQQDEKLLKPSEDGEWPSLKPRHSEKLLKQGGTLRVKASALKGATARSAAASSSWRAKSRLASESSLEPRRRGKACGSRRAAPPPFVRF